MKVAVVRNRENLGVIRNFGQTCPEKYGRRSVQNIVDALREGGHIVEILEGDMTLPCRLKQFFKTENTTSMPPGIVFNLAYGIQGESRYSHILSMLEMLGVPYTGAGPTGQVLCLDKVLTKIILQNTGLPTPNCIVTSFPDPDLSGLVFPLIVKPRHESTSYGLQLVSNKEELHVAIKLVVDQYQQDALVEQFIEGRELSVCIIGNQQVNCLPFVEFDYNGRDLQTLTWEDKYHKCPDEPKKICPAEMSHTQKMKLQEIAISAFINCQCRDYAKIDIRLDSAGQPYILEINSIPSLGPGASFTFAARHAGLNMRSMDCSILNSACIRYFGPDAKYSQVQGL
jgi:D-alanine-D-alanine ligase